MAAGVVIRLDSAAMARVFKSPSGPVGRHIAKLTQRVHAAAKRYCPVDTGRLRASIAWSLAVAAGELVGIVYTAVSYAIFQELGTRFMPAHPFLRPALWAAR